MGGGLRSKVLAIKGSRKSCFVNQLHWAPSEFEVGGHFSLLIASELQACQLSQLNPITASSISFGPMEHSLITSPKFSIIPTKALLWSYPEEFSLGTAGGWGVGVLTVTICLGILQNARLLTPRVPWDPPKQWIQSSGPLPCHADTATANVNRQPR